MKVGVYRVLGNCTFLHFSEGHIRQLGHQFQHVRCTCYRTRAHAVSVIRNIVQNNVPYMDTVP